MKTSGQHHAPTTLRRKKKNLGTKCTGNWVEGRAVRMSCRRYKSTLATAGIQIPIVQPRGLVTMLKLALDKNVEVKYTH